MEKTNQSRVSRMRTIKQCVEEIKKIDFESCISEWFIRCLCKNNKVKHFLSGNKVLVNFDDLLMVINFEQQNVMKMEDYYND